MEKIVQFAEENKKSIEDKSKLMQKFKPIEVVIHMPEDIKEFERLYIEATFVAIK